MLGILCGLGSEEKIAVTAKNVIVACGAARPYMSRDLARELVAKGATRLMSFGIAGSLESSVELGDLFIGTRVASASGEWQCDEEWGHELASRMPHAKRGGVYGSETLVATVEEKAALHQSTGCAIVDMESQCAAEVATEARIPLMVIRAVCDDANMDVPLFVMAAIGSDGNINVMRALKSLMAHPSQGRDLYHVMRGTGRALRSLKKIAKAI